MSIDVVSYSAMMGADEEGTMRVLREHRGAIDAAIHRRGGRIANTAGDSVLAEFGSPVEALRAAVDIQTEAAARNASLPAGMRMQFRVGVHLDDVIVQDNGDLLGEGVNIAARLQSIADPGGIMTSGEVAGQARAKLPEYGFERLGEPVMKNIVRTVEAFRIVAGKGARNVNRSDVSSTPGMRMPAAEKARGSRGLVVAAALAIGLLGGGAVGWGAITFLASGREAAEDARRKAADAEAARQRAEEAARQQAAARRREEQARADQRHTRARLTRSLDWRDIDCASSRIVTAAGMSCAASADYSDVDGRGRFRRWAAGLHGPAAATYLVLVDAVDAGSTHLPLQQDDEGEFLPEISSFTRNNAQDWSSVTALGEGFYATFKASDGRACFAFAKPGPARGDGLAWVLRGYHCAPGGQPLSREAIAAIVAPLKAR
jgi:class 3 adenylate cyclase